MRLIDAYALSESDMAKLIDRYLYNQCNLTVGLAAALMPEIEAEPVRHGRWIQQERPYGYHFSCSECGHEVAVPCSELIDPRDYVCYLDDYCGKCGARMDGRKHRISETIRLIPEE